MRDSPSAYVRPLATAQGITLSPLCDREDLRQAMSSIIWKVTEMESAQNSRVNPRDIIGGWVGFVACPEWAD